MKLKMKKYWNFKSIILMRMIYEVDNEKVFAVIHNLPRIDVMHMPPCREVTPGPCRLDNVGEGG